MKKLLDLFQKSSQKHFSSRLSQADEPRMSDFSAEKYATAGKAVSRKIFGRTLLFIIIFLAFLVMPASYVKASTPIKILLVPGHDDAAWGAQYGNIKEADMNLALANKIYNILKKDKRFRVYITRDSNGYTKEFADYFSAQKDQIIAFEKNAKSMTQSKITDGSFVRKVNTPHNKVSEDIALRLYGFNKWVNENKIDAIIHIHFNDYPRKNKWEIGRYKGFNIYVPDEQLANWKGSREFAVDIFNQLRKKYSTSTYKPEEGGLTFDQQLIAIGANNTLDASARSVLIEYGYIYEKKFRAKSTRLTAYKNMSSFTVKGIKNYFFGK